MFKPRYATFHQAVVACFQDGFQGLAAYTAAQTLLLNQYAHLMAHQTAATPQHAFGHTPEAPQAWYHLTFVSVSTQKASTPIHGVLTHEGQPLGHFSFQAQSVNTHLVQASEGLHCGSVHSHTLDDAHLVYQLEAIAPEHLAAYQLFHQAPHSWPQYRQQWVQLQHQPLDHRSTGLPPYPTQPAAALFGPRSVHSGLGQNAHIEGVKRIADHLVIHGWVNNPLRTLRAIVLTDINNQTALNLAPHMARFESPDVAQTFGIPIKNKQQVYRFITAIHMRQVPSALNTNLLNLHFIHEHTVYSQALPSTEPLTNNLDGLYNLLGLLGPHTVTHDTCHNVLAPIFTAVAKALQTQPLQPTCQWFNPSPEAAELSVIIPLYGNVRFEVTQIAALAALQLTGLEVIFAVDDPSIHADVLANVQRQSACFGLRCAVVSPGVNLGFSGINNFAVQYTSAPALLFLNSDCFITQAQPLQQGMAWLNAPRPKQQPAGALGFRLLYPGGKLQHDGMSNDCWADDPQFIVNLHPRIGQDPTQYPPGQADGQASLLTAACLLMHKHVFNAQGGFNRTYLRGDFEDSDLCLTLINAGYRLGLLQTHHIYHLERQTIAQHTSAARQTITLVNSHLYKQRWHSLIQQGLPRLEVLA